MQVKHPEKFHTKPSENSTDHVSPEKVPSFHCIDVKGLSENPQGTSEYFMDDFKWLLNGGIEYLKEENYNTFECRPMSFDEDALIASTIPKTLSDYKRKAGKKDYYVANAALCLLEIDGTRCFSWVPLFLEQYLRPLTFGKDIVTDDSASMDVKAGIRLNRQTLTDIRQEILLQRPALGSDAANTLRFANCELQAIIDE